MGCTSNTLDRVALAASRLELLAQVVGRVPLVRDEPLDALAHAVFDPRNLVPDLLDVGVLGPIALAFSPQPGVLAAQVGDRAAHAAVEAKPVTGLRARDLLPAVAAEDEDAAHVPTSPLTAGVPAPQARERSEEHTSELQSRSDLVCRLLLEKKKYTRRPM